MGMYDFNTPRYNVDAVIDALRQELRDIVISSESDIEAIKKRIASDEAMLIQLKAAIDGLPDYTAQYEEINSELDEVKRKLEIMYNNPIVLDTVPMEIEYITVGGGE